MQMRALEGVGEKPPACAGGAAQEKGRAYGHFSPTDKAGAGMAEIHSERTIYAEEEMKDWENRRGRRMEK